MSERSVLTCEQRAREHVGDELFEAFRGAVAHFGTSDLVVFFDESERDDPISILPRQRCVDASDLPQATRSKISRPASETGVRIGVGDISFWFVFLCITGEGASLAVNAKLVGPEGRA